jgi:hypothetical protein
VPAEVFDCVLPFPEGVGLGWAKDARAALLGVLKVTVHVLDVDNQSMGDLTWAGRSKNCAIAPLRRLADAWTSQEDRTFADGKLRTIRVALRSVTETLDKSKSLAKPFDGLSDILIHKSGDYWPRRS